MTKESNKEDEGSKLIERLKIALREDGDFPVRAKVVTEIRSLANNPRTTVDQITELILREPSLGTRVLHLVNSAFFQRSQPVMTITQAVLQLGMTALSDLCAGLVLMQKFVPAAKRGGVFADSVRSTVITALISNELASLNKDKELQEKGYLAGTFYKLGYLLLAYYFPQVYEAAARRAIARGKDATQSLSEILGASPVDLSLSIVEALNIPQFYRDVLVEAHKPAHARAVNSAVANMANTVRSAGLLADTIISGKTELQYEMALDDIEQETKLSKVVLRNALRRLPDAFNQHCNLIEMTFLELPELLLKYNKADGMFEKQPEQSSDIQSRFQVQVDEIKIAIKSREPISSVVTSVMEALVYVLGFHRAVLLYADSEETYLMGRLHLGADIGEDIRKLRREISDEHSELVIIKAFDSGSPEIFGEELFSDGWPFAAIPVGRDERRRGVIYADIVLKTDEDGKPLDETRQAALTVLTDLLDQSVQSWE
jgi:HD-like signal output (HDOD) protein